MCSSQDWAQYVLDLPMVASPGDKFEYCSGASYLLSVILQNATKMKAMDFATKYLFEPIGIEDVSWPSSPQGVNIGYGAMQLKPHDMARVGWLYLNKGRWGACLARRPSAGISRYFNAWGNTARQDASAHKMGKLFLREPLTLLIRQRWCH